MANLILQVFFLTTPRRGISWKQVPGAHGMRLSPRHADASSHSSLSAMQQSSLLASQTRLEHLSPVPK